MAVEKDRSHCCQLFFVDLEAGRSILHIAGRGSGLEILCLRVCHAGQGLTEHPRHGDHEFIVDGAIQLSDHFQRFDVCVGEMAFVWVDRGKTQLDPEALRVVAAHPCGCRHVFRRVLGTADDQLRDPVYKGLFVSHASSSPR